MTELRQRDADGTYRAVFTTTFEGWVYVLQAFQKKSRRGIATDKQDLALIEVRLAQAAAHHQEWLRKQGRNA